MSDVISLLGGRSNLRTRLLLELANNPGKEYTEAHLAKILNTTSSAVAKSLRPIAEGILKSVLKTYPVFNNRIYKFEDNSATREFVKEIAGQLNATLRSVERMDIVIKGLNGIDRDLEELKKEVGEGKISEAQFKRRVKALEKQAEAYLK